MTACVSFAEKPDDEGDRINGGFFLLSPKVGDLIDGDDTAWEHAPLMKLAADDQLRAFAHHGFWHPMDTLRDKNYLERRMGVRAGKMEDLGIDPEFWRGRRVLLTGHTGFKGAWLSFWLTQMGAKLRGLALEPPSSPSLFDLAHVADGMEDIRGDIRDAQLVRNVVADFKPDIVIHMAAQSLVRPSYVDPVGTYATNVMGTVHTLDAVRASGGVGAVLVITSDKCYLNRDWDRRYIEDRRHGRQRSLQQQQGLRGNCHRPPTVTPSFTPIVTPFMASRWPRPAPAMSSAAATGLSIG